MVTISRVGFERKLGAMASVLSSTSRRYPLLGLVQDGHIRLWQDGDMPVWKTEEIDSDENFFFSVPTNTLKDIVGGFYDDVKKPPIESTNKVLIQNHWCAEEGMWHTIDHEPIIRRGTEN